MRFQKMLKLEEQSILDYESLLQECVNKGKDEKVIGTNLEKLIADEKKHAKLVQELLAIVGRQSD